MRSVLAITCAVVVALNSAQQVNATVSGNIPFNTIVTGDQTSNTWTALITATEGPNTAMIQLTLMSANGELFNKLDSNTRLSIGTTFDDENHINVGEDPKFIATLMSQSGPGSLVGFNISSLGIRNTGGPTVSWTSSVTTVAAVSSPVGESTQSMDNAAMFQLLNMANYTATLAVVSGQFQFTDLTSPSGIGFNVQFSVPVPEPATATLGLLGFAGLMMRRRRMA